MTTTIAIEIQHIEHSYRLLTSLEVDLEKILAEEYTQELSNDLNNVI